MALEKTNPQSDYWWFLPEDTTQKDYLGHHRALNKGVRNSSASHPPWWTHKHHTISNNNRWLLSPQTKKICRVPKKHYVNLQKDSETRCSSRRSILSPCFSTFTSASKEALLFEVSRSHAREIKCYKCFRKWKKSLVYSLADNAILMWQHTEKFDHLNYTMSGFLSYLMKQLLIFKESYIFWE